MSEYGDEMEIEFTIRDLVSDLVSDFLWYDRKQDEDVPVGFIEEAVSSGVVSVDDIAFFFRTKLLESLRKSGFDISVD